MGFETISTTSGIHGRELGEEWKPDAVLTDLDMPDIDGFEICRRIRSNPEWNAIAVIFHTGSQPIPEMDAGYDAFLTYPVDTSDLVFTITGSIMRRREMSNKV
jgi:CheY-like chemotaxis protein